MFLLCIDTSLLIKSTSFKGILFISEVRLKPLSRVLLIKSFDEHEQNIHKSGQQLNWPLMKDLKRVLFWKGLTTLVLFKHFVNIVLLQSFIAFLIFWKTFLTAFNDRFLNNKYFSIETLSYRNQSRNLQCKNAVSIWCDQPQTQRIWLWREVLLKRVLKQTIMISKFSIFDLRTTYIFIYLIHIFQIVVLFGKCLSKYIKI